MCRACIAMNNVFESYYDVVYTAESSNSLFNVIFLTITLVYCRF